MSDHVIGLHCRACGAKQPAKPRHYCDECFGPLEVEYDYAVAAKTFTRQTIEAGPPTLWRYRGLLPVGPEVEPVTMGEGFTPLIHARNLGEQLGIRNLYLKNDTVNPTGSFKDRVVSVAATWAQENGITTLACASTGNLGNAVAAYAAHAGLAASIFIPSDLELPKVTNSAIFGPKLIRIDGTYDDVNRLCSQLIEELPWGFCNINLRAYYAEGSKTLTFETVEQLDWQLPDEIIIPVASGCQFVKHRKAIDELIKLGLVDSPSRTRLTGAQAEGCSPVATAFANNADVEPVRPNTVARSLAIGNPSDGDDVVRLARESGGVVESVNDEEILQGIELLARTEGIFAETAGGVTVGVLKQLAESGRWTGDETVVAYITGHGLKTASALDGRLTFDEPIPPTLSAFHDHYDAPVRTETPQLVGAK